MDKCIYCGAPVKKGHSECYGCRCTKMFVKNGGNTRKTRLKKAITHLKKKPGLLKQIFGI